MPTRSKASATKKKEQKRTTPTKTRAATRKATKDEDLSPRKNPSPIKKIVLKASPGRSSYAVRTRGTPRSALFEVEEEIEEKQTEQAKRGRTRSKKAVINNEDMDSVLMIGTSSMSTIPILVLPSKSASPESGLYSEPSSSSGLDSSRPPSSAYGSEKENVTPIASSKKTKKIASASPDQLIPVIPLKHREREFDEMISLVDESIKEKKPLTVYISGTPGTGKSATTRLVLQQLQQPPRNVKCTMITCTSLRSTGDVACEAMKALGKSCTLSTAPRLFQEFVQELKKCFVLVLDEADFVCETALADLLTMPTTVSHHLIVIGISNTIDFTERKLRKIKLKNEPRRFVFGGYSKQELADILQDEQQRDDDGEEMMDGISLSLCAGKVAAVSGDVRMAKGLFQQSAKKIRRETVSLREQAARQRMEMEGGGENSASSTASSSSTPATSRETAFKAINEVYKTVYASTPQSRASLPMQPKVLLAVCLKLSAAGKKKLTRSALFSAYALVCSKTGWPQADGDDLNSAFELIDSQGLLSIQKNDIRLRVDAATARSAICDNEILRKIEQLNIS